MNDSFDGVGEENYWIFPLTFQHDGSGAYAKRSFTTFPQIVDSQRRLSCHSLTSGFNSSLILEAWFFLLPLILHSHQDPTRASKSRKREILVSFIHSYPFSASILPVVSLSRAHSTRARSNRCDTHFHSITRQQQTTKWQRQRRRRPYDDEQINFISPSSSPFLSSWLPSIFFRISIRHKRDARLPPPAARFI